MEDRSRILATIALGIGLCVAIIVVIGFIVSRNKVVSPVPDEGAIKIIFITPTPILRAVTPTVVPTVSKR